MLGEAEVLPVPMDPEPVEPGEVMVEPLPDLERLPRLRDEVVPGVVDAPVIPVALEPMELFTPGVVWPAAPVEFDVPPVTVCALPAPMEPELIEPEPIEPVAPAPVEPAPVAPAPAAPPAPPAAPPPAA